jgi:hypothetical protein
MPGFSRLDSVLEAIRARSRRNRMAVPPSSPLSAPVSEVLERRQLLSVSSIQVQFPSAPRFIMLGNHGRQTPLSAILIQSTRAATNRLFGLASPSMI